MKNLSKEDEYIGQLIPELGTENASIGFHKSILERLSTNFVSFYRPVISSLA